MLGRRRLRQLLLALGATFVALLLVEIGVRVVTWARESARLQAWQQLAQAPPLPPGEPAKLAHLIRPTANPRRVYELIPGLDVMFQGARVRTDAAGRRCGDGADAAASRDGEGDGRRTVRITGIGDSVMFGWGVAENECFLRVLERLLRQRHPELAWRAINTAVPGYNTVMEVETLKAISLSPPPDLVLVDVVGNDRDLPNFIAHRTDYWSPSTSFLLEWIVSVNRGFDTQSFRPLAAAPMRGAGLFVGDPQRVPPEYRDMVGEDAFRGAIAELNALSRQHGFHVLASCFGYFDDVARGVLAAQGVATAQNGAATDRHMREHGIDSYQGALTVSLTDAHPNAMVHTMHAETIYEALAASGILARLLAGK